MKRHGNLYQQICSLENLEAADIIAQKGKSAQRGVIRHNRNRAANISALRDCLLSGDFKTSPYTTFKITDPKERIISRLPYCPDRIVHHAIMNVIKPVFLSVFTADTYNCIEGRGVHGAVVKIKTALRDEPQTRYCLKLDIRQFYPSVDHEILKALLRRKFKDVELLSLMDEIIDSTPGLPIGNYLSQYFANFYLTYFDHWIKEVKGVKHYFRYADDLVILGPDKAALHGLLEDIRYYLHTELHLAVKPNSQVFPVAARGIDFLGYRFFHTHTLLRKRIKRGLLRSINCAASLAAYKGWAKHCNSKNLLKKLIA